MSTTSDALSSLVNQFSDPLSFYRELIQNAVDAGSAEVEISLEHVDGVMIIRVDDFGEGMNREIIDSRLTRLFSSRKDGDLTKIGKFGIGFVSVFAIVPDAVVVDTSRDGENWRVLFNADRSFERIVREQPVEGTKIRIIKAMGAKDYEDFERRSGEVIRFWCRHVDAEIRVQGQTINRPFELASLCQVRYQSEGTEIVVGYPRDGGPRVGFYNRGLTLFEGRAPPRQRASVMVNSRHLEHTLARDDVRQDEGYHKVMKMVDRLLNRDLPRRLHEMVGTEINRERPGPHRDALYAALARCLEPELSWVYPAVELHHGGGHREGYEWVGDPSSDALDSGAHLVHGPYTREIPKGRYTAAWTLAFDWRERATRSRVATLDVYDAESKKVLAERTLRFRHLPEPGQPMMVALDFKCSGDERLEFRTMWHENIVLRQRDVRVSGGETPDPGRSRFRDLGLFRTPNGSTVSIADAARASARDRLFTVSTDCRMAEVLKERGKLVIELDQGSPEAGMLNVVCAQPPPRAHRLYCLPLPVEPGDAHHWPALREALKALLERCWSAVKPEVVRARFDDPGSAVAEWVALAQSKPLELEEIAEVRELGRGRRAKSLVVNTAHATVERLVAVAAREPELAACLLLKVYALRSEPGSVDDADLTRASWELRWQRLTS